ncbi:Monoterpene epsilon-lactone hydrolase [Corynebacterium occultum]|uniref:Monoterpene epsilon-lactone hydrolase n=1 Tax=Corynebacterium occultum TaxID=2675219 RepID=A0A6B8W6R7_9CORY|nr:alpha/beta hydrolase [Corynebacterium occultum]QGU06596.1 Monoterpene epsilon-lactone hydrolase [Corynebacterium occultum]
MTASELQQIQELQRAGGPDFKDDALVVRRKFEEVLASLPVDPALTFETRTFNGIEGIWAEGPAADSPVILYLHGGAYVVGTAHGYSSLSGGLAQASDAALFSPEYRLAPEHRFPAAIDDALDAYRGLLDSGYPAERILVAGDSAGGGLAAALLVAIRGNDLPQPAAAWLLSPWADLTLSGETVESNAEKDLLLDKEGLLKTAAYYLGGQDPTHPLASPVFADLSGLAPLMITVGSSEILLDDAFRLAKRAAAAETSVRLEVGPQLFHDFPLFGFMLSEGREALSAAGDFFRSQLISAEQSLNV